MNQVSQALPLQRDTASLSTGAQLFVFSARQWLASVWAGNCPHQLLQPFYARFDATSALPVLDELMFQLTATAFRPMQFNCPCRCDVGDDEYALLVALQKIQRGDYRGARQRALDMLPGPGASTLVRIGQAYVAAMREAKLSMTGVSYLQAVLKEDSAS